MLQIKMKYVTIKMRDLRIHYISQRAQEISVPSLHDIFRMADHHTQCQAICRKKEADKVHGLFCSIVVWKNHPEKKHIKL